jgi:DNA segregation ATPase FtsK/SpoIIIE, S-DNA-T family
MPRKKAPASNSNTLRKGAQTAQKRKSVSRKKTAWTSSFRDFLLNEKVHMVFGLFLLLFSLFLFVSFTSFIKNWLTWGADDLTGVSLYRLLTDRESLIINTVTGRLGAWFSFYFVRAWFGLGSFALLLILFTIGLRIFLRYQLFPFVSLLKHTMFWMVWVSVSCGFLFPDQSNDLSVLAGQFGVESSLWLSSVLGRIGAGAFLIFGMVAYLIWVLDAWDRVVEAFERRRLDVVAGLSKKRPASSMDGDKYNTQEYYVADHDTDFKVKQDEVSSPIPLPVALPSPSPPVAASAGIDFTVVHPQEEAMPVSDEATLQPESEIPMEVTPAKRTSAEEKEHYDLETLYNPKLDLRDYRFPPLDLLDYHGTNTISVQKGELESNKNKIIQTLKNYSIDIERIKATIGPTVTLYEIVPAPGIRISKIKNLEDDIALSLSALGIRIIAPIPGKGTIGIEVPNMNPEIVSMRTILSSERFRQNKYELPIGLGKTIANETYVADLTKMPHLLIAGATGQGKSVGLNAIITSLLYTKHPAELKFVLVDPKKVELSLFSRIQRHFLAKLPDTDEAIITDTRVVVRTLHSLCLEMDNRYNMLKQGGVRNIGEYNTKFISRHLNPVEGHRFMPYIVLIVDEFADLIMTAGKEIEGPIARLAQLARAVGIHLVIATQRPSVNIITGTIKANFPARIAFRVTAKVDSRTILDSGGAEQLVGRGDMLLYTGSDLTRLQCAFLDIPEVEKITDFIGSQRGYPEAYDLPEYRDESDDEPIDFDPEDRDDLFEEAARMIVRHQHGSTSLLQRKLKLGYNRAGRLIDQLEAAGIVGPFEGSKAREVLFQDEVALEQYLRNNFNAH